MIQERFLLETDGKGYWSDVAKEVDCEGLKLAYINEEGDFGELRVYFDTSDWDTIEHGLIYTDRLFMQGLKSYLTSRGFDATEVDYSEMGMQGRNYVSCDVGQTFIESFQSVAQ